MGWPAQRGNIIIKVCARGRRTATRPQFLATALQPCGRDQAPKARQSPRDMRHPVSNGSKTIVGVARFFPPKSPLKFLSSKLITWLEKSFEVSLLEASWVRPAGRPAGGRESRPEFGRETDAMLVFPRGQRSAHSRPSNTSSHLFGVEEIDCSHERDVDYRTPLSCCSCRSTCHIHLRGLIQCFGYGCC